MTETHEGLPIEITSPFGFEATLARVSGAIEAAGLIVFARIDHAANAREAGLAMPPAVLLVYGHARGGTPLMLAAPRSALDLPLRVLVRESDAGAGEPGAVIAYHPMAPALLRAGVPESLAHRLDPAQRLLEEAIQP